MLLVSNQRNDCQDQCQECFPYVSSRGFILSNLTFKSVIYFEFIFVYDRPTIMAHLHSFACRYPGFPIPFVENTYSFPHSPIVYSWHSVEDQLTLYEWAYFRALKKISQLYYFFTRVIAGNISMGHWKEAGVLSGLLCLKENYLILRIRTLSVER